MPIVLIADGFFDQVLGCILRTLTETKTQNTHGRIENMTNAGLVLFLMLFLFGKISRNTTNGDG